MRISALTARDRGWDPAEVVIFAFFAALSLWTLGWLVGRVVVDDRIWTGAEGLHPSDQLQYLSWIRDAGNHVLISNMYDLRPTAASFLHPGFLLSGALTAVGVAPWLAYLLWKPVVVVALFLAVRAYVHRTLGGTEARRAALILALFFVPTAAFIASVMGAGARAKLYLLGIEVDMWPGTWLWGYAFTALAVAAIPAALLLYERDRARGEIRLWSPLTALVCSWFQPWQGATLLVVLVATEGLIVASNLVGRRRGTEERSSPAGILPAGTGTRLTLLLGVNVVAAAAPLLYYALLSKLDPSWELAGQVNRTGAWPVWALAASIAPLALPGALAYLVRPLDFQALALRVWAPIVLALYWLVAYTHVGTFPIHMFQGLTIPLAILAVVGAGTFARSQGRVARVVALCIVAALTVPALVWKLNDARRTVGKNAVFLLGAPPNPYFLTAGESDALRFVERDPRAGGVLTASFLGELIPAATGRSTWVGLPSWTPEYGQRISETHQLFNGGMAPARAIAFVRSTGARYLIADCRHHGDLEHQLQPIVDDARRFGCASVLHVSRP